MQERFKIEFLQDAREFLAGLGEKTQEKIIFNIDYILTRNTENKDDE